MRMYDLFKKGEKTHFIKKKKSKPGSLISCHTFEHLQRPTAYPLEYPTEGFLL